ncbi:MAG TPA: type II toxin-antitoxin system RelE/ParE family toxin [Terricaulis sp.]|nr:type II toxin-antitoxin system RelE/ParE family toxin [Terricaulis sp.]HRP11900.1 type II toxin-antitoxin system RelE/ParE family toxin [Terricaulis sp.]
MSSLPLSDRARADLEEIAAYISARSPKSAARMLEKLLEQCRRICEAPLGYPSFEHLSPGVRRAVCRPYLVFFVVDQKGVRIERIVHGARDLGALLGEET